MSNPPKTAPTRVLCVDDHAFLVDGLKTRIEVEPDMEFAGRLESADDLVSHVKNNRADIVLLDIEMPGPDPFEAATDVRRQCPDVRIIFLSAYVRDHYISAAVKAGAWGYFSKSEDAQTIVKGIRRVAGGDFAFSPKVQQRCRPAKTAKRGRIDPPSSKIESLTAREQEVLRMIGKALTRSEIAEMMCRSPKTIDGHRESIMEKLDIHDRAELVRFAIREGLVEV